MLYLTSDYMPYNIELRVGNGTFMKMRLAFLERFDALMNMSLHVIYDFGLKNRVQLAEDAEFKKEFFDSWKSHMAEVSIKTKILREYKLELDDFSVISEFAWHSDCDGELSASDCKKLLKFLSLFQEIEWKREEEGEDNLFWYIPKCMIHEYDYSRDSDLESDGMKRLYDVVSCASEHNEPLLFK